MWDLDTIVRLNDEAQRRADAVREYEARERQADEHETVVALVALGSAYRVNGEGEQAA
jgi:hypothetical protein